MRRGKSRVGIPQFIYIRCSTGEQKLIRRGCGHFRPLLISEADTSWAIPARFCSPTTCSSYGWAGAPESVTMLRQQVSSSLFGGVS
ncbi:hypothetical protein TNCT_349211 [Trichonephila clavata]|uniref:Uncharacterized protein n=1 Tax=Trichonephila clavata TaxID=2740835 RepID=A0A8X6M6I9_TRICU|nr:hypothetical protein TNCT_349211 [Trichonephila clavata]